MTACALVWQRNVTGASKALVLALTLTFANLSLAAPGASVLILVDANGPGTSALTAALAGVGNSVTVRPPPEYTWNGTNPSLAGFNCVIHLDGATFDTPLPVGSQTLLETFVSGGGGFIASQWDGYERAIGQQTSMNNLVLQLWPYPDNCGGCSMTWTRVLAQAGHPVLTGIPSPFTFNADGHDAGALVVFGVNPSTVLMTSPGGGPAVTVRQFGSGRVVNFSHAANYAGTQLTLQNSTIQALYINAVGWACNGPFFSGAGAGCPAHTVHGHIVTVPPGHYAGTASHGHQNQHGHHVPLVNGCPPTHGYGHSLGLTADDENWSAQVPAAQSDRADDGGAAIIVALHPTPGYQNTSVSTHQALVGDVVELYGSADGLFLDEADQVSAVGFTAPVAGEPLYHTTELPEVRLGDRPAQVLFSGLAPGRSGVWQIKVVVPPGTPVGSLPVTISYGGEPVGRAKLSVR